jgi:hypothetical protein
MLPFDPVSSPLSPPPSAAAGRHARARELFLEAAALPAADRPPFLEATCGDDRELVAEVESLLAFHDDEPAPAAPPAGPRLVPGELLADRFRLHESIEWGGPGQAAKGWDLLEDRASIVVLVPDGGIPGEREAWRTRLEGARSPFHPAIAGVQELVDVDGGVVVVLEPFEGDSLSRRMHDLRGPAGPELAALRRSAAVALAALHGRGIVHGALSGADFRIGSSGRLRLVPPLRLPPPEATPLSDVERLERLLGLADPAPLALSDPFLRLARLGGVEPLELAREAGRIPNPDLLLRIDSPERIGRKGTGIAAAVGLTGLLLLAGLEGRSGNRPAVALSLFGGALLSASTIGAMRRLRPDLLLGWSHLVGGRLSSRPAARELSGGIAVAASAALAARILPSSLPAALAIGLATLFVSIPMGVASAVVAGAFGGLLVMNGPTPAVAATCAVAVGLLLVRALGQETSQR